MGDGWDLVRADYGEVEALARVARDAFRGISIIPRLPPGQVRSCCRGHLPRALLRRFWALLKIGNSPGLLEKLDTGIRAAALPGGSCMECSLCFLWQRCCMGGNVHQGLTMVVLVGFSGTTPSTAICAFSTVSEAGAPAGESMH